MKNPAPAWNIDTTHSAIEFSVRHLVITKVRGRFGSYRSELELDENDLTRSKVSVTIDAASIDTGVADRDTHLRSPDFFDVERYPELRFESRKVERVGDDHYRLHGELTIRDVTREIALDLEYGGSAKDPWGNQRAGFVARGSLDRKDFGLEWNQALETGGVLVGDRVDLEIELQAVKSSATKAA